MSPSPAACLSRRAPVHGAARSRRRRRGRRAAEGSGPAPRRYDADRLSTSTTTVPAERPPASPRVDGQRRPCPARSRTERPASPSGRTGAATSHQHADAAAGVAPQIEHQPRARRQLPGLAADRGRRRRRSPAAASRGRRRRSTPASASAGWRWPSPPASRRRSDRAALSRSRRCRRLRMRAVGGHGAAGAVALDGDAQLRLRPQRGQQVAAPCARWCGSARSRRPRGPCRRRAGPGGPRRCRRRPSRPGRDRRRSASVQP